MWLDGDRQRREIAVSQVPGRTDRGLKERRDGTSRGVAVCLCFPAIRKTSRGCYQGAPFGVPPPSLLIESERSPEIPTHVKEFAGSDDACLNEGRQCAPTLSRSREPISTVIPAQRLRRCRERSRALARRLEGWPQVLVAHPSRLAAKGGEHLRMTAEYFARS
jgi:hypothetical protein